jgi:hypothetical protein
LSIVDCQLSPVPQRFAILIHRGHGPDHFDLLLEQADALATWRFLQKDADPRLAGDEAGLPCRRIADHRKAYLDYEGPVSRGRGEVRRVEAGTWTLSCRETRWLRFELSGQTMRGVYELRGDDEDAWTLRRVGKATTDSTETT